MQEKRKTNYIGEQRLGTREFEKDWSTYCNGWNDFEEISGNEWEGYNKNGDWRKDEELKDLIRNGVSGVKVG